jgi:hypothetical protein
MGLTRSDHRDAQSDSDRPRGRNAAVRKHCGLPLSYAIDMFARNWIFCVGEDYQAKLWQKYVGLRLTVAI